MVKKTLINKSVFNMSIDKSKNTKQWWTEEYGFFGDFYMQGDNSIGGYHIDRQMRLDQRTKEEVEGAVRLCDLHIGDRVLDCPSGYGRHSISLALMGLRVFGLDINSAELSVAKRKARKKGVVINFVKGDMLEIKSKNKFDAVINMWYSFGFFATEKDNTRVLKNFFNALKKGGRFLMHTDVNVPRVLAGGFREYEKRPLVGGGLLRQVEFYNKESKRNFGVWIIEKEDKVQMKNYSVRVYSKEEFVALCKQVGFRKVAVYSDWNGNKYSPNSEDMIVVATK